MNSPQSQELTISESPTSLPDLYDRVYPKATDADFASAQAILATSFGSFEKNRSGDLVWTEQQKFQVFKTLAIEAGWSGKRLEIAVKRFMATHVYPTWKPADLLNMQGSKLHRYPWYVEQCRQGNAKFIEAYRVKNIEGLLYRMSDGTVLPPEFEREF
jgi:hypothetical protein